jgi:acetylornithine deacetylase/succinyl-diaminopimelate desuccinylase-like protein
LSKAAVPSASQRITRLAALPQVHQLFRWLHLNELRLRQWQLEVVRIPAPPFAESNRAQWLLECFRSLGLDNAHIDDEGNVLGEITGADPETSDGPNCILLSAHLDTVFPAGTDCTPTEEAARGNSRIIAPGICDNAAGIAAMLGLAAALRHTGFQPQTTLLFVGSVGEEAEGNLRGMRYIFERSTYRQRIAAAIALDGSGCGPVVTHGLGSRRYRIIINGPGGHSWSDAGAANPVAALSHALSQIARLPLPANPRTTLNIGTISGGTAVNAIPEEAVAQIDIRSTSADELLRLEVQVHRAVEDAILEANRNLPRTTSGSASAALNHQLTLIGNRPEALLPENAHILQALKAVDRHLGIHTSTRIGSTDANIPLALGIEAISLGAGGTSGGIHTRQEWFDPEGRELALRRILLLLLDLSSSSN